MANIKYKQTIDLLETLRTFDVLESMKFREEDVKKTTFRTMMYQYQREGKLGGEYTVISLPNSEYVVTRTA